MAKKEIEPKIEIEREYIVPLRHGWLKVPEYKRATKAIKTLKEFIVKHMKVYDRDLRKVKVDIDVNNEIRFRGMRKPLAKIKIKAVKFDDGIVKVELVDIHDKLKYKRLREEKKKTKKDKKAKPVAEKPIEEKEKKEISEDDKEKEKASKEEGLKLAKQKAKEQKHIVKDKKVQVQRKALSR